MSANGTTATVIVVAAGQGARFGSELPKQFLLLQGRPVLAHTLAKFDQAALVKRIIVVAAEEWLAYIGSEIVDRFEIHKCRQIVAGGATRQDSVWAGLQALDEHKSGVVVVHDGVRPLFSYRLLEEVVTGCDQNDGCIPATMPKDTVKLIAGHYVSSTIDRETIRLAQTPQAFRAPNLIEAYRAAMKESFVGTDEASIVERNGGRIKWIEGEEINLKITTPHDLELAQYFMAEKSECE